jgi:photosystem II stability/assembly factor-like uncharacterized protein
MRRLSLFIIFIWSVLSLTPPLNAQWWPVPIPDSGVINTISANNNYLYLGLGGFSYGLTSIVYRSTDNGATWQSASHGLVANDNANKFAYLDTFVLLGTDHGLYSSSNHGDNWINMGMTKQVLDVAVAPNGTGDTNIYLATNAGFYYTTDRGSTWQLKQWRNGLLTSIAASGSNIFALITIEQGLGPPYKDSILLSTDYGSTWGAAMNGLPNNTWGDFIAAVDSNIFVSLGTLVFSSSDEGKNWHQDTTCPTDQNYSFLFAYNKLIFAGNTLGIFVSTDYGTTWIDSKYPGGNSVWTIGICGDILYAGPASNGGGGIVACFLHTFLGVKGLDNVLPEGFTLKQNYPNPFNPTTKIQFTLPHESHVTLKVYNLLGQEVQTLVNDMRTAGSYNVEVDASNLSSGLYFYRLSAGDFIQTKKMLLIR